MKVFEGRNQVFKPFQLKGFLMMALSSLLLVTLGCASNSHYEQVQRRKEIKMNQEFCFEEYKTPECIKARDKKYANEWAAEVNWNAVYSSSDHGKAEMASASNRILKRDDEFQRQADFEYLTTMQTLQLEDLRASQDAQLYRLRQDIERLPSH